MNNKRVAEKNNQPVRAGVGMGVLVAILVSVLLAMILAALVINERISENTMHYFTLAILLAATLIGGLIAAKRTGGKCALVSGLTALAYCLVLVGAGVLFFDGGFHNLWTSVAVIAVGFVGSCALCISGRGRGRNRKRFTR